VCVTAWPVNERQPAGQGKGKATSHMGGRQFIAVALAMAVQVRGCLV
jgi:hypothetical protein